MNAIRLLIYIIILIISMVNMISYYSKKKKQKKLSNELAEALESDRTLNAQEAAALKSLNNRDFQAGMPVTRIEGIYEFNMLTVQGSASEKVVTIGGIVVNFEDQLESHLQDFNTLEIVGIGHKKGAAILNMNGSFSAVEEAEIRTALANGQVYQKRKNESFEFHSGRELNDEERYYLKPDYRVWPSIICALFAVAAAAIPYLPAKAVFIVLAVIIFIYYLMPVTNRAKDKKYQKKIINLSGTLEELSGSYSISRFQLEFPEYWEPKRLTGQKIKLEAYPMDELGVKLKVLSLNAIHSVKKEQRKNPLIKKDRFLSLSLCMVSALVLLLIPLGKIPYKMGQSINYFLSKDLQEDFNSFEELRDYPLRKGQLLNLSDMAYMPNYDTDSYGVFVIEKGPYRAPDLSIVKDKIEALDKMQMSEEMFFMKALSLRERIDMYSFYNEFYPQGIAENEELPSMRMYEEYFSDSKYYYGLLEIMEAIDALPEDFSEDDPIIFPEGGYLKDHFDSYISEDYWNNGTLLEEAGTLLNQFNWEQYIWILDTVDNEYLQFLNSENALFISSYDNIVSYEHEGNFPLNDSEIEKFYTSIFHMSTGEYELEIAEPIEAIAKLKSYEEDLKQSYSSTDFKGVITEIEKNGDRITGLKMKDINYNNLLLYLIDTGLLVIVLLVLAFSCVMWFRLRDSKKE